MFRDDNAHNKFILRIKEIIASKPYKNDSWGLPLALLDIVLKDEKGNYIFNLDESVKKKFVLLLVILLILIWI